MNLFMSHAFFFITFFQPNKVRIRLKRGAGRISILLRKHILENILSEVQKWTNLKTKSLFYDSESWQTKNVMMNTQLPEISNIILFLRQNFVSVKMLKSP